MESNSSAKGGFGLAVVRQDKREPSCVIKDIVLRLERADAGQRSGREER